MSSITVQVIFFGLMGFVPNEGGQKGMTALIVDPPRPVAGDPCSVPPHVPLVLVVKGKCAPAGNCLQEHVPGKENVPLKWQLDQEDLEIFGRQKSMEVCSGGFFNRWKKWASAYSDSPAPNYSWELPSFSWVPSIDRLTGGYGHVREDFLQDGRPEPPVTARFLVRGGQASACHLIHKIPVTQEKNQDEEREITLFHYDFGGRIPPFDRAVADAVQVEFEVEGRSIDLYSWDFSAPKQQQELKPKRAVRLSPLDGRDVLTLIVANVPLKPHEYNEGAGHSCPPHSDIFYSMLARESPYIPTRTLVQYPPAYLMKPGSCEEELSDVVKILGPYREEEEEEDRGLSFLSEAIHPRAAPHSRTFCDGMAAP
jgi:hypothetical protein